jgi:hypothetical protein
MDKYNQKLFLCEDFTNRHLLIFRSSANAMRVARRIWGDVIPGRFKIEPVVKVSKHLRNHNVID